MGPCGGEPTIWAVFFGVGSSERAAFPTRIRSLGVRSIPIERHQDFFDSDLPIFEMRDAFNSCDHTSIFDINVAAENRHGVSEWILDLVPTCPNSANRPVYE